MNEVVHIQITPQCVDLGEGVVTHADHLAHLQPTLGAPAREFRGLDELGVVMGALGQHFEQVFGADDREKIGLQVAIQG